MGCDDSPPLGKADPGLRLPSDLARRAVAPEQRGGDGAVAAVGHDPSLVEPPGEACGRAGAAEGLDRLVAVQIFGCAVPDRGVAREEKAIERGDVV
jgi:hypothetical protein